MRFRKRLLALALAGFIFAGCVGTPTSALGPEDGAGGAASETAQEPFDAVRQAETILAQRFAGTGYIEQIVRIEVVGGLLRVTLDRPISTLGDADAYTRMCTALTELVRTGEAADGVAGVQFFRADGTPVVAGGAPNVRCEKFWL